MLTAHNSVVKYVTFFGFTSLPVAAINFFSGPGVPFSWRLGVCVCEQ